MVGAELLGLNDEKQRAMYGELPMCKGAYQARNTDMCIRIVSGHPSLLDPIFAPLVFVPDLRKAPTCRDCVKLNL